MGQTITMTQRYAHFAGAQAQRRGVIHWRRTGTTTGTSLWTTQGINEPATQVRDRRRKRAGDWGQPASSLGS
jgi:hypothetical protein